MQNNESLVTPIFKSIAVRDETASKAKGRPIFKDVEVVEVRISGERHYLPTFGAHDFWKNIDGIPHTYAMRWPEQYRRFKEGHAQTAEGTPIDELPFLSMAKRSELKALSIYTAEALSSLDGKNLKVLGIGGRELKDQATAYLEHANGSAGVTALAKDNAALREEMERMREEMREIARQRPVEASDVQDVPEAQSDFATWSVDELKGYIKETAGAAPRGNPSHETLVRMADELSQKVAA